MAYYFAKEIKGAFDEVVEKITEAHEEEGFGILTRIDLQAVLKKKLGVDFRPYLILGACNHPFSYKALTTEDKIGLMLPCNVIAQEKEPDTVEVVVIDPVASMQAVDNPTPPGNLRKNQGKAETCPRFASTTSLGNNALATRRQGEEGKTYETRSPFRPR